MSKNPYPCLTFFVFLVLLSANAFGSDCWKSFDTAGGERPYFNASNCYKDNKARHCQVLSGVNNNAARSNLANTCIRFCDQVIAAGKCNPNGPIAAKCEGSGLDCQKAAADNAEKAAEQNRDLAKNAKDGGELAESAQQDHLRSIDQKLKELEAAPVTNTASASALQNDQRIFQQVKRDIKEGKMVSEDYAALAKTESIQSDLRAVAFYSDGKKGFANLASYHQEQIKKFETILEKTKKGTVALESVREVKGSEKTLTQEGNEEKSKKLAEKNGGMTKADELPKGLTADQVKELDKKLAKISNRALRERLRARLMAKIKVDPEKAGDFLEEVNKEILEIVELEKKTNDPRRLDDVLHEAVAMVSQVGSTEDFSDEIKRLEDEKMGILGSDSLNLFDRIHGYLMECQKRQCVVGP
jgi:hypothetical protein